jgi:hypothetical protein
MLIHHEEMVAIVLHEFVPSMEMSEHVWTLGDLLAHCVSIRWHHLTVLFSKVYNGVVWHRCYCGDFIMDRLAPFHDPNLVYGCSFKKLFFSWCLVFFSIGTGTLQKMSKTKKHGRKKNRHWPIMWLDKLICFASSFEWIYEKEKIHSKVREGKNWPAWRCFVLNLSWQHCRCLWRSWILWSTLRIVSCLVTLTLQQHKNITALLVGAHAFGFKPLLDFFPFLSKIVRVAFGPSYVTS